MEIDDALIEALRLATEPPGGVTLDAVRDLGRDDAAEPLDIAAAAECVGVSAHALRYYERIGLLDVTRNTAGHRRYDAAAIRRLVFITRMRAAGMPIADLQRYVALVEAGASTTTERLELMLEHRDTLRAQIAELQLALAVTEFKIATYEEGPRP